MERRRWAERETETGKRMADGTQNGDRKENGGRKAIDSRKGVLYTVRKMVAVSGRRVWHGIEAVPRDPNQKHERKRV